jgi:nonspecific dipeptidase
VAGQLCFTSLAKLKYYINFKVKLLQHLWRFPSLSLHGIEGAHVASGCRTVIPAKVLGKFSIHIVPNQTPEKVEKLVVDYLNKKWKERASGNSMTVRSFLHKDRDLLTQPLKPL